MINSPNQGWTFYEAEQTVASGSGPGESPISTRPNSVRLSWKSSYPIYFTVTNCHLPQLFYSCMERDKTKNWVLDRIRAQSNECYTEGRAKSTWNNCKVHDITPCFSLMGDGIPKPLLLFHPVSVCCLNSQPGIFLQQTYNVDPGSDTAIT